MRPVSPFLSIYRPQIGSTFSILERITGLFLLFFMILCVCLMGGQETLLTSYFFYVGLFTIFKGSFGSFVSGGLIFFIILCFVYHLLFSFRYIVWSRSGGLDERFPLDLEGLYKVSYLIGGLSILLSLVIFLIV